MQMSDEECLAEEIRNYGDKTDTKRPRNPVALSTSILRHDPPWLPWSVRGFSAFGLRTEKCEVLHGRSNPLDMKDVHVHLMVGREGDLEDKSRSSDVRWRVSSPMRAFLQHEFAQVVLKNTLQIRVVAKGNPALRRTMEGKQ